MPVTSYLLGHQLLCTVSIHKLHLEKPGRAVCGYAVVSLLQQMPHQPGEKNMSAVPVAPCLLAHAFLTRSSVKSACSEMQQDNWHHEQDQQYNSKATTLPDSSHCRYYIFINTVPEEIFFF